MGETDAESRGVAGAFDPTRRGYDRRQVDDHVTNLLFGLSEAERARDREPPLIGMSEVARTARVEERGGVVTGSGDTRPMGAAVPLDAPTAGTSASVAGTSASSAGFGHRVEKILLVAEQEAAETRRSATRESTALVERARAETEALRHEAERAVLAYRDEVDRLADQRAADLDERERRIEWQRENARVDAEQQLAEARREADRILSDALGHAEAVRAEVDEELEQRRAEVERQMGWLEESRRAARDLAHMLLSQTGDDGEVAPSPSGPERSGDAARDVPAANGDPTVRAAPVGEEPGGQGVADVVDPAETVAPRRYSPAVSLPAELRFAGSIGGIPVLDPDQPEGDVEPAPRRRRTSGRADRDWFGYGDTTERLHAVRSPHPDSA